MKVVLTVNQLELTIEQGGGSGVDSGCHSSKCDDAIGHKIHMKKRVVVKEQTQVCSSKIEASQRWALCFSTSLSHLGLTLLFLLELGHDNMQIKHKIYNYKCELRHKTFHSNVCYHIF